MNILERYRRDRRIPLDQIDAELTNATQEELIKLLELVNKDAAHIKDEIEKAKVNVQNKGEYADPDWFRRAQTARRIKGQLTQRIQNELTLRRKAIKIQNAEKYKEKGKTEVGYLLEAIGLVLTPDQKEEVLTLWRHLCSQKDQDSKGGINEEKSEKSVGQGRQRD